MNKKGQAAMEFLMTYGWAILVVIAAIAALAYFGVLDPARLLPERCQFPAGMDCIDKASISDVGAAGTDTVTIALRNNIGFPINVTELETASTTCTVADAATNKMAAAGSTGSINADIYSEELTVDNNEVLRIQLTCTENLDSGDKFEEDITVSYENLETGLTNKALGNIRGRVA